MLLVIAARHCMHSPVVLGTHDKLFHTDIATRELFATATASKAVFLPPFAQVQSNYYLLGQFLHISCSNYIDNPKNLHPFPLFHDSSC